MWYRVIKWVAWMITVGVLAVFGLGCLALYSGRNITVYNTPFGKMDTDTLKIGLLAHGERKPCYIIHREIKHADTLTYYFQPKSITYYMVMKDSCGELQVWEWDKYNRCPLYNVTKQFKKRDIIIR